MFAVASSF